MIDLTEEQIERYSRHILLQDVGLEGQEKLLNASGATVYKNDKATLDASNTASGYIMVKYTGSVGKIKVQVSKSGSETYTYDLNSSGTYEVFPLSEGNGTYQVKVFENIQGTQYSQAFSQSLNVDITDYFVGRIPLKGIRTVFTDEYFITGHRVNTC